MKTEMVIRRDCKTYTLDTMKDNFDSIPQVRRTDNGFTRFRVFLLFFKGFPFISYILFRFVSAFLSPFTAHNLTLTRSARQCITKSLN